MTMKQLINVMDLQLKLRALREDFQSTRPLLPEETRDVTYEKQALPSGRWITVTEPMKVQLRQFGIPTVEARMQELCDEMREVKQQIIDLGDVPEGWEMVNSNKGKE